ncbi:MAG TPA: GxxExxY protein [Bacteroidetes bacterium]|nr:GxxExxY protein [Bacteroidota bacterium]
MKAVKYLDQDITELVIHCFYKVYNTLGYGFLERVYLNALMIELKTVGLRTEKERMVKVFYDNKEVGTYLPDLIVEDQVILELKAAETLMEEHEYQLLNYLKATDLEVGLLLNFGKKAQIRRKIFENKFKTGGA